MGPNGCCSVGDGLNHDALTRAFLGGFEGIFDQMIWDPGQTPGTFGTVSRAVLTVEKNGFTEMFGFFLDNPEAVAALGEDIWGDLLADAVARTKILIDPNS